MEKLSSMNPASVDLEIRSLSLANNMKEVMLFLEFLQNQLVSNRNFELVQSFLNVFLKIHGSLISENEEITSKFEELIEKQKEAWQRLQDNLHHTLCLIDFCRNVY